MAGTKPIAWVTGAAGFIGSNVAVHLAGRGWSVIGIDRAAARDGVQVAGDISPATLSRALDLAGPLGDLMVQSASRQDFLAPDMLLVLVPVTPARLAERGYNQAWELCRVIGRRTGLQTMAEALVRLGDTSDQHRLTRAQRLVNLRGAFVVHPLVVSRLAEKRVVLVDDVRTTGATLHHAGLALRHAGATEVRALVLARTPQAAQDGETGR